MTPMRCSLLIATLLLSLVSTHLCRAETGLAPFDSGSLDRWQIKEGHWSFRDGHAVADEKFSVLLHRERQPNDLEASVDLSCVHTDAGSAAGLVFRFADDSTGYLACLREMEKGVHPQFGPWERPTVQLFRIDHDGWKLLQESKVMGWRADRLARLKVICRGPSIWVFYDDMKQPVLTQYDATYDRAGSVGLLKDQQGVASFANFATATATVDGGELPLRTKWSEIRGAVYVRSNAVNAVQMWEDYWDHTAVLDREFSYASDYGFNMMQVYLHWIVWDRHGDEYLKRIDDLLTRAAAHGLKVNLIFWDDCGNVEPSLTFAAPVPGRHNSQMMPNPSHAIRDSAAEMNGHRERFEAYVKGVAGKFKDDLRIAFFQLYNEGMGPKEQYRHGVGDANLNRLLEWTHDWVKSTGTKVPVTATGGGFYGPQFADFYTYHSYRFGRGPLPNTEGGPEHLCTETLNRPDCTLTDCVHEFAAKRNGFVVWDLMIGRDNCRYPWGHPDGLDEPTAPFHGVIYPDGHPWDVSEIQTLLGEKAFATLQSRVFKVEYFSGNFEKSRKSSITPRIDFDLADEPGYGSPDASAGIGRENFSIRWTGETPPTVDGSVALTAESDGTMRVWIGQALVIDKTDFARGAVDGSISLKKGERLPIKVENVHHTGSSSAHLYWKRGMSSKRIVLLDGR